MLDRIARASAWWLGELATLTGPDRPAARPAPHLQLQLTAGPQMDLHAVDAAGPRPLGRFATDAAGLRALAEARARHRRLPLAVAVGSETVLTTRLHVPLAAHATLAQVLSHELDCQTPFSEADVYWAFHIESVDRAAGRLRVRLTVAPRAAARPALDMAERAGLAVAGVAVAGGGEVVPLVSPTATAARQAVERRRTALWVGAFLAAAAANLLLPLALQWQALSRIEPQLAEARAAALEAAALRATLDGAGRGLVADERQRRPDPLALLALATEALPDHTHLIQASLADGKLTLGGYSKVAAEVLERLAAVPGFHEPAFAAPVVKTDATQGDYFVIVTTVGGATVGGDKAP